MMRWIYKSVSEKKDSYKNKGRNYMYIEHVWNSCIIQPDTFNLLLLFKSQSFFLYCLYIYNIYIYIYIYTVMFKSEIKSIYLSIYLSRKVSLTTL